MHNLGWQICFYLTVFYNIYHTTELVFPVYESTICLRVLKNDVTYGNRNVNDILSSDGQCL